MFRFIKMWLLLRILAYQEEYVISNQPNFENDYKNDLIPYCEQKLFVLERSKYSLLWALLPKKFQKQNNPSLKDSSDVKANKSKIRELDSILKQAAEQGYLETPKAGSRSIEVGSKTPRISAGKSIRLSPRGDHFITYAGGLESIIKEFPRLWGIIGISIIPWSKVWIYIWKLIP